MLNQRIKHVSRHNIQKIGSGILILPLQIFSNLDHLDHLLEMKIIKAWDGDNREKFKQSKGQRDLLL